MSKAAIRLEEFSEAFPDATLVYPTGYEDCVIGVESERHIFVMDANKILQKLRDEDGMSQEDALEHFYINIQGSKGEGFEASYVFTEPFEH